MANTVIALKKSAIPSSVPADLANGELAINFADGKLFYKHANGTISAISSSGGNSFGTVDANGTLVVADTTGDIISLEPGTNIAIVGDAINDKVTISLQNDVVIPSTGTFKVAAVGGDEGGEIKLANAITNSVLTGDIVIDVYQNRLRFYESAGTNRGAFINLASAATGVGTDLLAGASATDSIAREWATAAFSSANAAFTVANTANITADRAWNHANAAFITANIAFANANTVMISAQAAFTVANSGFLHANASYAFSNSISSTANLAFTHANNSFARANTANITADRAFNHANAAFITANIAFANANTVMISAQAAFTVANSGFIHANSGYAFANSIAITANLAFAHANSAYANGNVVIQTAQSAFTQANAAIASASAGQATANAAFARANLAHAHANAAFAVANTSGIEAEAAFLTANISYAHANAAFTTANNALPKAGGTITGDLVVQGNATISGLTTYANTQTLLIGDNIIILNADLPLAAAPSENAGVTVNRGSSANVDLIWNEGTDKWTFNEGTGFKNIASNTDIESVTATAVAAFGAANTAGIEAEAAFLTANISYAHANAAFTVANTSGVEAEYAFLRANLAHAHANASFAKANAALPNTAGVSFAGTLTIPGILFVTLNGASSLTATGEIAEFAHNANSYTQIHVRNANTGQGASGDLVVTADTGTDVLDFIDIGINGSGYSQPTWTINGPRDGYLYTSHGNLAIGVANVARSLAFFTGGTLAVNERMRIDPSGNVGIGTTSPSNTLHVIGTANISGTMKSAGLYDSSNRLLLIKDSTGTVVWGN